MIRKEQNKILDDKIEANNVKYNLDRMNVVTYLNTNI